MDLIEALKTRKSFRAFQPDPVPVELVNQMLDAVRWSPSWGNTQPWELVIVGGETAKKLTAEMVKAAQDKVPAQPDVHMPHTWPDAYKTRYMACAMGLFGAMGIAREDKAGRVDHMLNMTRAFGAPVMIYVTFNGELNEPYSMLDMGAIIHAICLVAHAQGLGTCILAQLALYPDIVRRHLNIPETHRVVVGIALGYPDASAPANTFRTGREAPEKFARRIDF